MLSMCLGIKNVLALHTVTIHVQLNIDKLYKLYKVKLD